jgi:predicted DsbA family dithiol-disulfide isomerase
MASVAARLEKSAQNYAQRLANDTEGTPEGKLQEYQNRIAIALKRAEKTLEDLERGAASLGLSISADADTTRHRTMSVSLSAKTRASLYAQMIGMVEDDLFRESAEVDDGAMPPEVLADILEEQGEDTLAFRAAFAS